ncbi:hypothetical protein CHS0354_028776 [Potamilus streckersoni]|uniref:Cysteine and tyrosine-rich protein 1 n=1 Tax=Potamilus streckersoni TaxID=2493646 RepID=A0AAE0VRD9_9BIVA|nr:hypothetical protein CHS0354_028776 [Potamilus streckersoni]
MSLYYRLGLFFLVSRIGCALGENCYNYYNYNDASRFYLDCAYGCCGSYYNQYCCVNVGAIVGGVIGSLIFIGIVITIISCLCCACCQSTRQSFAGTVFRTNHNAAMTNVAVQQPGYVQPYVIQNAGYQLVQTQPMAVNVYVQGDAKDACPSGPVTNQTAQAPPPYMA